MTSQCTCSISAKRGYTGIYLKSVSRLDIVTIKQASKTAAKTTELGKPPWNLKNNSINFKTNWNILQVLTKTDLRNAIFA